MDKKEVAAFFDSLADSWDSDMIKNQSIINSILFENLSGCLNENGRITVAHGMSREALIRHHSGKTKSISTILPETDEMAELMKPYFIQM